MAETGTLGVRYGLRSRIVQERWQEVRDTEFGPVSFKVSEQGEKPEYEECRRIARERGIPCREVMRRLTKRSRS
jgi:uncharacterized protein (DUF111 family)